MGVTDDHQSGYWAVPQAIAEGLVGKHIYLHKKQALPSWHGGTIVSYRMAEYQGKQRVVFVYQPAWAQSNVTAPSLRWGAYTEKLITGDGIHLLHKSPQGRGIWGRSQPEPMGALQSAYLQVSKVLGEQIEPYESIELVEAYRQYFRPKDVNVILLAESHVFTTIQDTKIACKPIQGLSGYPSQYAKFVYCLGYGERSLTLGGSHPGRDGTPQFWKILYSCSNDLLETETFAPVLGKTPLETRIRNKVNILKNLQAIGVWLVDTSIAAVYSGGTKLNNMNKALATSWEAYTRDVILSANPKHVICIGKGVAKVVEPDLKRHFPGKYSVVAQPNAFLSAEEHMANYAHYSNVCRSYR